jgi:SAM-dependent methyltransferase
METQRLTTTTTQFMTYTFTDFLYDPETQSDVVQVTENQIVVSENVSYPCIDGIPVMLKKELLEKQEAAAFFENFYQIAKEPWDYSERAAELLRHDYVIEQVANFSKLLGRKAIILDIGCSLGHITARLHPYAELLVGMDVSITAIRKARLRCTQAAGESNPYMFVVGSATELPFKSNFFDIVVASDGLHGWHLSDDLQAKAVKEIYRVMKPVSYAVFTDYLHPRLHPKIEPTLRNAPWQIERTELLYDRLWYRFESLLKAFRRASWVQKALASKSFALFLRSVAQKIGKSQSKHIAAIVHKK